MRLENDSGEAPRTVSSARTSVSCDKNEYPDSSHLIYTSPFASLSRNAAER